MNKPMTTKPASQSLNECEFDRLALDAAKRICQQGYNPEQAQQIVNPSDHAHLLLLDWFGDWSRK